MNKYRIILFGSITLQSCNFQQSQPTIVQNSESEKTVVLSREPLTELNGSALYTNHCSLCHGNLENSQKRGRLVAQIQWAIDNIPIMAAREDLGQLTLAQLQAIEDALKKADSEPPPKVEKKQVLIGNRFYMASLFRELFETSNRVEKVIESNIKKQGSFFGGTCSLQSDIDCYKADDLFHDMNPTSQVIRQGLIAKSCDEIMGMIQLSYTFLI